MFAAAWQYRAFLSQAIIRDLRLRVIGSRLGVAWLILQPLAQVALFAVVLSGVMASRLPGVDSRFGYTIYLCAGMAAWSLFIETITRGTNLFVENGQLIKKMAFRRSILPLVMGGTALLTNVVLVLVILVMVACLGHPLGWVVMWLPLLMLLTLGLGVGLGVLLGVVQVFIRDVGHLLGISLQFLFWATPIAYLPSVLPEALRPWLWFNPLAHLVGAYQDVLVHGTSPAMSTILGLTLCMLVIGLASLFVYRRGGPDMVDVL